MTDFERSTEHRLAELEDQQTRHKRHYSATFLALDDLNVRTERMGGDIGTLKADVAVLKTDVAVLTTDVGTLKDDMVEVKGQLNRFETANQQAFDRIDARFETLIGLIEKEERGTN